MQSSQVFFKMLLFSGLLHLLFFWGWSGLSERWHVATQKFDPISLLISVGQNNNLSKSSLELHAPVVERPDFEIQSQPDSLLTERKNFKKNNEALRKSQSRSNKSAQTSLESDQRSAGELARNRYQSLLLELLESHKYYPERARRHQLEGLVQLSIVISHSGRIEKQVVKSSGVGAELFKEVVEQMVVSAQPLPKLPEELGQQAHFLIPVEFRLSF